MRVVINKCYGGFSVSREALHWLRQRGMKAALEEIDIGEPWDKDEPEEVRKPYLDGFLGREVSRSDPDLIACVEELGEKVNGPHARLSIVEIPDGVEYTIEEYDGVEWVAEKHRTWN